MAETVPEPPRSVVVTDKDGWHYDPPRWCAGVWVGPTRERLAEPQCCEVHLMPWGHLNHLPPGERRQ